MFCSKCGTKAVQDATFCQKCGTTILKNEAAQPSDTKTSNKDIELIITSVKVEGKSFAKFEFAVLVDGVKIGDLINGGTLSCNITPGHHCVKIGRCIMWIDVPTDHTLVTMDWIWDDNFKTEIVCHQGHLVTKPCETEKLTFEFLFKGITPIGIAGLLSAALGIVGIIAGLLSFQTLDGPIVSAEQHAMLDNSLSYLLLFGGLAFMIIGALIMILASRKAKK